MSMRVPEKSESPIVSINNYKKFGLREKGKDSWVSSLIRLEDEFFKWHPGHDLGNKMVQSAKVWFRQANLVEEKTYKLLPLTQIFKKHGGSDIVGWEFIWLSLVNNAVLLKWFAVSTTIDTTYDINLLTEMIAEAFPSLELPSIDGGLSALKDLFDKSPLGSEGAVALPMKKGSKMLSITRKAKSISPLTILYGLYLISKLAKNRNTFTIRQLMTADMELPWVSPIIAFGIDAETFMAQCRGLSSRYSSYITCTFAHGLDELTIYPEKYTAEDIIHLLLEE
jgi:hypothetical protein